MECTKVGAHSSNFSNINILDILKIFLSKDQAAFGHTENRMPGKYTF